MTNIAFIGYRDWSINILRKLARKTKKVKFIFLHPKKVKFKLAKEIKTYKIDPKNNDIIFEILNKNKIEIALFYGWSWIVKKNVYNNFLCLGLHPSKLPEYKGGSPLQHQIIDGKKKSAVTVFKINKTIDGGEIFKQTYLNLKNPLNKIFHDITKKGYQMSIDLVTKYNNNQLVFKKQKIKKKIYLRRKPWESELKMRDLKNLRFNKLNNFVRALDNPYPNAFIKIGKKTLNIRLIKKISNKRRKITSINTSNIVPKKIIGKFIKLKDSYAKILKGSIH